MAQIHQYKKKKSQQEYHLETTSSEGTPSIIQKVNLRKSGTSIVACLYCIFSSWVEGST